MNLRQSLAIGAALIVGMGLGGICSWQPSFAQQRPLDQKVAPLDLDYKVEQQKPLASRQVGRYQVAAFAEGPSACIVVVDTATGQCWTKIRELTGQWADVGSPRSK